MDINELKRVDGVMSELRAISRKLHRIFERQCNGYGFIPDGPYTNDHDAQTAAQRDEKREEKLIKNSRALASTMELGIFIQGDPRGCALYLVPADWTHEYASANYPQGIGLY